MFKKHNIHFYLNKPKYRALVLFPPLLLLIIGVLLLFLYNIFKNIILLDIALSALWLLLGLTLITYSDIKRIYNNDL